MWSAVSFDLETLLLCHCFCVWLLYHCQFIFGLTDGWLWLHPPITLSLKAPGVESKHAFSCSWGKQAGEDQPCQIFTHNSEGNIRKCWLLESFQKSGGKLQNCEEGRGNFLVSPIPENCHNFLWALRISCPERSSHSRCGCAETWTSASVTNEWTFP